MSELNLYALHPSDLKTIKIEVSPDEPYGRRFKVKSGTSECTVVFQDLYLLARQLDNQTNDQEEMLKIRAFVNRLIEVESDAKDQYDKGDAWYKFRTFFHRIPHIFYQFYGVGSHLDRLKQLDQNLIDKCESTLKKEYDRLLTGSKKIIFQDLTPSSNMELSFLIITAQGLKKNYQELGHHVPEIYQLDKIIGSAEQKKALLYIFEGEDKTLRDWDHSFTKPSEKRLPAWRKWLKEFEAFVQTFPSDHPNKQTLQKKVDELKHFTKD